MWIVYKEKRFVLIHDSESPKRMTMAFSWLLAMSLCHGGEAERGSEYKQKEREGEN